MNGFSMLLGFWIFALLGGFNVVLLENA